MIDVSVFVFSAGVIGVSRDAVSFPVLTLSFHQQSFIACQQTLQTRRYPGKCLIVLALALAFFVFVFVFLVFAVFAVLAFAFGFALLVVFALLVAFAFLAFAFAFAQH